MQKTERRDEDWDSGSGKVNGRTKWVQNKIRDPAEGGDHKFIMTSIKVLIFFFQQHQTVHKGEQRKKMFGLICLCIVSNARAKDRG